MSRAAWVSRFPKARHGTRSRYLDGCRCEPCRKANAVSRRSSDARARAAAAERGPRTETHCIGVDDEPCPTQTKLQSNSIGNYCARCRHRLVWNGFVPAERARAHLFALSAAGIGRRSVADATDVSESILQKIRNGTRTNIRAWTERKILAVDVSAAADRARIDARPVWRQIRRLVRVHGFTLGEIARRIGQSGRALQLGRKRVTALNAHRVAKLLAEADGAFLDDAGSG